MNLEIVKTVYVSTVPPEFIRQLVDIYFQLNKIDQFIGIHWRYNSNDFYDKNMANFTKRKLKKSNKRGLSLRLTKELQNVIKNTSYLFDKIRSPEILLGKSHKHVSTIIISSPFNMAAKFDQARSKFGYRIFTTKDSRDFLWEYRDNCEVVRDLFGEVLSTFEKEIMLRATVFYRSRPSNWSFNVQGMRWSSKKFGEIALDKTVFDLFVTENCGKDCLNANKLK